jgi:hypothetical protein
LGLSPSDFWDLTPLEINAKIEGHQTNLEERYLEIHTLAALVGTAINNPKKFPQFKPTQTKKQQLQQIDHDKEMRRQANQVGMFVP